MQNKHHLKTNVDSLIKEVTILDEDFSFKQHKLSNNVIRLFKNGFYNSSLRLRSKVI